MEKEAIKVLLVEDDEDDYIIARDLLAELGPRQYRLTWISNFDAVVDEIGKTEFDVCLFDYHLGEKDGVLLIQSVREKGYKGPIIMLTGQKDRETDLAAMNAGAADYLVKGNFDSLLLERAIRYAIERHRTLAELKKSKRLLQESNEQLTEALGKLNQELELAREIQHSLLPRELGCVAGAKIAAKYMPCEQIGGDLFDVIPLDNERFVVLILDVMGHGIPAALTTTMAKVVLTKNIRRYGHANNILAEVNREISDNLGRAHNLTVLLGIFDMSKREALFARAGHPPALLLRSECQEVEDILPGGSTIGFYSDIEFEEQEVLLKTNDHFLFFTDGIIESRNVNNEMYGKERLKALFQHHRHQTSTEIVEEILLDNKKFMGESPQRDDITLLSITIK